MEEKIKQLETKIESLESLTHKLISALYSLHCKEGDRVVFDSEFSNVIQELQFD